jgi:hypothetical protein
MSYGEYHRQSATITSPGVPGESEPYARLADGRVMPMGWNMGESYPVGTTGTAMYAVTSRAGLWHFTAHPPEETAELTPADRDEFGLGLGEIDGGDE